MLQVDCKGLCSSSLREVSISGCILNKVLRKQVLLKCQIQILEPVDMQLRYVLSYLTTQFVNVTMQREAACKTSMHGDANYICFTAQMPIGEAKRPCCRVADFDCYLRY